MQSTRIVCAAFLITILTSSTAWATAFSILDIQYEIMVAVYGVGVEHESSGSPLYARIADTLYPGRGGAYSYAEAIAIGPFVGVDVDQPGVWGVGQFGEYLVPGADATAMGTITFAPNFDGYAKEVLMYGVRSSVDARAQWWLTDLTTNTLVSHRSGFGNFSDPLISGPEGSLTELYAWDSTHTYQLQLQAYAGGNHQQNWAYLTTDLFQQEVPDYGTTLLLLSIGLVGLRAWRKRWE